MIPAPGAFVAGVAIFLIVLWEAFEAIILPRRVTRRFRLTRVFYKFTWTNWKSLTRLIPSRKNRETGLARMLVVMEAGFGFGFLAAVIGYLPFIYGSFSKREVNISLLDARAGTPPTAAELLRRHAYP